MMKKWVMLSGSTALLASTSLASCQRPVPTGLRNPALLNAQASGSMLRQANAPTTQAANQPLEQVIEATASQMHEIWRSARRKPDGTYEPRLKETKDSTWIAQHGSNQVDIANTAYAQLPNDWKAENQASAAVAVNTFASYQGPISSAFVEQASNTIHIKWLERNSWAKGGELDRPYAELPENEKQKDREVLYQALDKAVSLKLLNPQQLEPPVQQAIQAMLQRLNLK